MLISVSDIKKIGNNFERSLLRSKRKSGHNLLLYTLNDDFIRIFLIKMKSVMWTPMGHAKLGLVLGEVQWADRYNISLAEGQ